MTYDQYTKTTDKVFVGQKVRLKREMKNGRMVIPAGSICTITRKFGGFNLNNSPCEHCGVRIRITRVPYQDVDLI